MVDPVGERYEGTIDGESAPVVQRPGARWPLLVGVVLILALVAVAYVNRGTIAAPSVMAYTENKDAYQTDALAIRQRRLYMLRNSMHCDDVALTPISVGGLEQHAECVQERQ